MDLRPYLSLSNAYEQLSLKDLLDARDLYHVHLMQHPNVVASAVGRYRIRSDDSWPDEKGAGKKHGTYARTLDNSEVRPYSWPAVLVFVEKWADADEFAKGGDYDPDGIVPKTLYLPDGRRVPVCIIESPRQSKSPGRPLDVRYPLNNIGGGYPVTVEVQGEEHVATIACLVTDGHRVYALTNRHVTGEADEALYCELGGKRQRIGVASAKQLTRMPFTDIYPTWAGREVYVNLDAGLIVIDNLNQWTAQVREVGTIGPMADLSVSNMTLSLIGCHVRGYGSGSGQMFGEIQALFYRYKSQGGFEYVADFFIGPRSPEKTARTAKKVDKLPPFSTRPGDSGTLFLLEPVKSTPTKDQSLDETTPPKSVFLPLAVQWGESQLGSSGSHGAQSYALATCLSTLCARLGVDPVRDWNLDQNDTWGAIGHFSIATRIVNGLSNRFPRLVQLMTNHLNIISHDEQTIRNNDFKNMGTAAFVPLADVPDFYWKHGKQGASRGSEGPNHFADMDQKRPSDGVDLLTLCKDPNNINPDQWNHFYDSVKDLLTGGRITAEHRGLLPFRVWQIFDEMIQFVKGGKTAEFVCAAGVLAHYVGDACQPLHISYLHDGDPERPVTRTVHHQDGTVEEVADPLGTGCHSAYEDEMVNAHREAILDGLKNTPKVANGEVVNNGFDAAQKTIDMMRKTFGKLPPGDIVQAFVQFGKSKVGRADFMWKKFGTKTIQAMQDGTHLLAVLWESAWNLGGGNNTMDAAMVLTEDEAMAICADRTFLTSWTIDQVGKHIKKPTP